MREEDAQRQARERAEAEARAERAGANRERVEWRQAEYRWKVDRKEEERELAERLGSERQERLDRLRAMVAPRVEADPLRVLQPTAASSAQDEEGREQADGQAFRPVHGYTVKELYRDPRRDREPALSSAPSHHLESCAPGDLRPFTPWLINRFKVMDALQRQGLHNTAYGRQVIAQARTAKPTRPDNLTFLQRAAYSQK